MNNWLKFDAKVGDDTHALSINLEHVEYVAVSEGALLFNFAANQILSVGPEDSPAGYKVDDETMQRILRWLADHHIVG